MRHLSRRHWRPIGAATAQNSMSSSSNLVGLDQCRFAPGDHVGQRHDALAIGAAVAVELDVIGVKAGRHRRIHRVGHRQCAEQIRPAMLGKAFAPDRRDPVDIGLRPRPYLEAGVPRLEVHRQCRAQIGEPRMHLAADRAAAGAGGALGRQQSGFRVQLVQIFADRQRVPDPNPGMGQARHQDRRRQQQQFGAIGRVVDRHRLLGEFDPGHPAQQPAAQ